MTLAAFYAEHFEPDCLCHKGRDSRTAHRRAVERFVEFLGREPMLTDLRYETIEVFAAWLTENGFGSNGGYNGRSCLLAAWRHAYVVGLIDEGPQIRKRKKPRPAVEFLTKPIAPGAVPSTLMELVRAYSIERGLSARSASQIRYVVQSYGQFLNRRPRMADLREDRINQWIIQLQESKLAPETISNRRRTIKTLWQAAFIARYVSEPPLRLRRVRVPQRIPFAWSHGQLSQLLAVIETLEGRLFRHGVECAVFWRAWVLTAYYSGLRPCDLLQIRFDQISETGRVVIIQQKTGNSVKCCLPPECLKAIEASRPPNRRYVFRDLISPGRLQKGFRAIVRKAKLRGSAKTLRATGATYCEDQTPGSAMKFLGHRTPGLAYKHYVDPRLLREKVVGPPAIGGTK